LPDHLDVVIYNSAGEAVKHLFSGASQELPAAFSLSGSLVAPGLPVNISLGGILQGGLTGLSWAGLNDASQVVSGGIYTIKVSETDPFGNVVAWSKEVSVLPPASQQSLAIYNSAGELVANLDTSGLLSPTAQVTGIGFPDPSQSTFVAPSSSAGSGGVTFVLQQSGGAPLTYTWNGRNNQGQLVSSGSYTVQLVDQTAGSASILMSKTFTLLKPLDAAPPKVLAGPNPLGPKDSSLIFAFAPLPSGQYAVVKLYNVAGELIAQGLGSGPGGKVLIKVGNWSGGIYVAVFEVREQGSLVSRQLLRLAIQR
jgi:hypothetical protein